MAWGSEPFQNFREAAIESWRRDLYKGWIYHASRGFFMHRTASACGNQDSSQSVVSSKLAVRPASSWRMPSIPVKAAKSFSSNFLDRVLAKSSVCMGMSGFDLLPLMCSLSVCLRNRASTWGTAGLDLLPLTCFLSGCLRHRASTWGMAGFAMLVVRNSRRRICWFHEKLSCISCCYRTGVSVTLFGRESTTLPSAHPRNACIVKLRDIS